MPSDDGGAPQVRIVMRPIGSPLPLGFFAFGIGTMLYTGLQLDWIPPDEAPTVAVFLVALVGPLELIAALFAYLGRDAGAATTLALLGATWIAVGSALLGTTEGQTSVAVGFFLLVIAASLLLLLIPSLPAKPYLAAVIALAVARFSLTGVFQMEPSATWAETAAGWLGLPLAAASAYGALALLLEDAQKETILPTARRRAARAAVEEGPEAQTAGLESEAGVRNQL